jgi:hypothetical protein
MRGKQIAFFAEEQDLRQLITAFEATTRCQYYEAGSFESSVIPTYESLLEVPRLGWVQQGDWNQATRLLVLPVGIPLVVRTVAQRVGGERYFVDQLENPYGFLLTLGGTFQPGVLVASGASTLATDAASLSLFGRLAELVKKQAKVGTFYVGKHANRYLHEDWRLVTSANSPRDYDLPKQ